MKAIWVDAQISPKIAKFIQEQFNIDAYSLYFLGMLHFEDREVFFKAKEADVIILTKDSDFVELLKAYGAPPKVVWLTCGNTSNSALKEILSVNLLRIITALDGNENIIEVSD